MVTVTLAAVATAYHSIRWETASNLGKIGTGNQIAIPQLKQNLYIQVLYNYQHNSDSRKVVTMR
ncbi:hypothetical protein [Nostoc sp.]|uniref:hypothetical protein n=1 Tax=Nostoc sp. TaxID=1180 RepID=UPI002FF673DF